jgi:hypothetical protein
MMFSIGSRSISARTLVKPPIPESKTPMGRCLPIFSILLPICPKHTIRVLYTRHFFLTAMPSESRARIWLF